ncbi:MAG: c-type cytochrome [Pseudomonadota bacterium]
MMAPSIRAAQRWLAPSLACLTLMGMSAGAVAGPAKAAGGAPSFSRKIQPIFDANCVACHQTAGASGGLNLEEGLAYRSIVSRKSSAIASDYIAPGMPQASYLLRKLEGTHGQAGGSGEQMPPTGPLDKASIALIQRWIETGAKND